MRFKKLRLAAPVVAACCLLALSFTGAAITASVNIPAAVGLDTVDIRLTRSGAPAAVEIYDDDVVTVGNDITNEGVECWVRAPHLQLAERRRGRTQPRGCRGRQRH